MSWNWETGKEEAVAYPNTGSGIFSPPPPSFWGKANHQIQLWEAAESRLTRARHWEKARFETEALIEWGEAEVAVAGFSDKAKLDSFRRGYLEWLAGSNGVGVNELSDLEISQLPLLERIVARGYRELAKIEHPDMGGSNDRFNALRDAKQQLDLVLSEVGDILKS